MSIALLLLALAAAPEDDALEAVAKVHGEAGPWAVAGWRMAKFAQRELGERLEVKHESPRAVQLSCIADGAQAATGASVGKLSLTWVESTETRTTFTNPKGKSITLVPAAAFIKRFKDAPREKARENGRAVLGLKDEEIFARAP
ncbi:MAG: formylmethanofuran dehydrogenase subunit E family protein [Archangiaceae bacterium]|nr:formylmethanofuran dehydrogenase subunit E family protein [Archangiaceae bacterium]